MDKLSNKQIVDKLTRLAKEKGAVWLEEVAYELDTTPSYLRQFARMASAVSGGELVLTYQKDQHDGHKAYVLTTKGTFEKYSGDLGPGS